MSVYPASGSGTYDRRDDHPVGTGGHARAVDADEALDGHRAPPTRRSTVTGPPDR
jgi:hypothetical protein